VSQCLHLLADWRVRIKCTGLTNACNNAETIPAAKGPGDLFVMRVVLHDWSDAKTLEILTNVRKAIGEPLCSRTLLHGRQRYQVACGDGNSFVIS
jgi:O-methyltransferase domain